MILQVGPMLAERYKVETSELIVDVQGASRWFGSVQALNALSIQVPKGAISVLLGPNGAGKTTAIRLITGALSPDVGTSRVFGLDPSSPDGEEVRRRCGVVSAKPSLYDRLSGWDNLRYSAELYGLGRKADGRILEAATTFGIEDSLDHHVGGYSTGMKTRLALARAILHEPDLLLLDEPTSGLDPESAQAVLEMIRDMTGDGQTVLMCTHLLLEAEGLADEIVVMQQGTDLLSGRPDELSSRYWPQPLVTISSTMADELDRLATADGVLDFDRSGDTANLQIDHLDRVPELIAFLVARNVPVTSVVPFDPTLEDLYFAVRREQAQTNSDIPPPMATTSEVPLAKIAA
jgi:ABC-2 type transport system ATP-binding protein